MNQKYNASLINEVVSKYHNGESASILSAQHGIPRSTLYSWIKRYGIM